MPGFGKSCYWGRRETRREGLVVIFTWISSQEKPVNNYVQLYSSLGWNSFVCRSKLVNLIFPKKSEAFAFDVLKEVIEDLKTKPCPLVFASFSGGPKATMCKILQIIEGKAELLLHSDDSQMLRDCISGFIYDSCPIDITTTMMRRFATHPTVINMSHPPRVLSWIVNGIGNGLDAFFLNDIESQRAEYWQTLYSSVSMGAPYLIVCSENDEIALYQDICIFAQRTRDLGGDVQLVTMNNSPHVGHYMIYPDEYKAAVAELFGKATAVYSQRIRRLKGEGETQDVGSLHDKQKVGSIQLTTANATINVSGVLEQVLFDVSVSNNAEDCDIKSSDSSSTKPCKSMQKRSRL